MFRIKELREARGISARELSELSGVSYTTIYFLENNLKDVALSKTLLAIAKALGVTISELFLSE